MADSDMSSPPNLQMLVQQLERERLVTSRSDDDGNVAVTIRTHVSKLAPASVDPGVPSSDPIGRFAGMVSSLQGNVKQPTDPMIEIRVEARADGVRRIVATGPTARMHANQRGGTGVIRSTSKVVWEWKPVSDHELVAPDRSDVLVVGKIMAFRRGDTGFDGAHGSLDQYTDAELRQLGRRIASQRQRGLLASAKRRAARDPSIPARWNGMQTAVAAVNAEFNELWLPIDRAAMVDSKACTPFWPISRRTMPRATAADAPQDAGWTCTLADGNSSFSVAPDAEAAWLTVAVGSGKHETIMRIELDESR
jgi:hypothetical protein